MGQKTEGEIFCPSLDEACSYSCANKMVQCDTWRTINKTMACCCLLKHTVQWPEGQVKEMQAHSRNLTYTRRTTGYVVMLQIEITNHAEGDRRDITSPEVFP